MCECVAELSSLAVTSKVQGKDVTREVNEDDEDILSMQSTLLI